MDAGSRDRSALTLRWIWLAWAALVFTALGFVVFGFVARGDPTPRIERVFGSTALFAFLAYAVGQGVAALLLVLLAKRRGLGLREIGFDGRLTGRGAVLALAGWLISFFLFYAVRRTVGLAGIQMFWNESEFFALDSIRRVVVVVFATILIAPPAEEMIYRGYVLKALLGRFNKPLAAVLSSLIFASIHIGVGLGLAIHTFLGGLILAYLYVKFRNVYPCIVMHAVNNVVAYIVIPLAVSG
jgi:membrane protease YdiL (CAAX protease family)